MFRKTQRLKVGGLFLSLLITLLLSKIPPMNVTMASPEAKIYVSPSASGVAPGNSFSVDIKIKDATDVWIYQVFLKWNSTILDVANATEGTFLSRSPRAYKTWFQPRINNTEGWVALICTIYGEDATAVASGSGTLATVNFQAKAVGESVLNLTRNLRVGATLYDAFIKDYNGVLIPFTLEEGYFAYPLPKIFVDPPSVMDPNLVPGTSFAINISVVNIKNLYSWGLYLKWDPALFNVTANEILEGPFLKAGGYTTFRPPEINQEVGTLFLNCSLPLPPSPGAAGVSGNGTLVTITFQIETLGSSTIEIDVDKTKLLNSELASIPRAVEQGYFKNLIHDVAIISVEVSHTEVKAGETASVIVVVKNKGTMPESFNVTVWANYILVGIQTLSDMAAGANNTLTFTWNTKDAAEGLYTIKAEATRVPEEIDVDDNEYTDGTITVTKPGQAWPITLIAVAIAVAAVAGIGILFYIKRMRSSAKEKTNP